MAANDVQTGTSGEGEDILNQSLKEWVKYHQLPLSLATALESMGITDVNILLQCFKGTHPILPSFTDISNYLQKTLGDEFNFAVRIKLFEILKEQSQSQLNINNDNNDNNDNRRGTIMIMSKEEQKLMNQLNAYKVKYEGKPQLILNKQTGLFCVHNHYNILYTNSLFVLL